MKLAANNQSLIALCTMSLPTTTLDAAAREFAEKNLGETDITRHQTIREIREWLHANPNLNARHDDRTILAFLRGCKFNTERAKQKIENFYRLRAELPEWFANRDPRLVGICELVRLGVFVPLRRYQDDRLVVIIRTAAHDPKVY